MERLEQYVLLYIRFYFSIVVIEKKSYMSRALINDKLFVFSRTPISGVCMSKKKKKSTLVDVYFDDLFFSFPLKTILSAHWSHAGGRAGVLCRTEYL